MKKIDSFKGENSFLSNFYEAPVIYEGVKYNTSENAYQAAKCVNPADKQQFINISPGKAKRLGKKIILRSDWEDVKVQIMKDIIMAKFTQNEDLKEKLLSTDNTYIEEGNTWGDRIWGTVNGVGANNLGKILMAVREELQLELDKDIVLD